MHSGSVTVKDTGHFDIDAKLSVIIEKQGFRTPFPLVIACSRAKWIDCSPIFFGLRVHFWLPVDLGSGSLEYSGTRKVLVIV